jgi:methionyl-tRNA formyltransferase
MAPLLKKDTGLIDWTLSAREIHNRIRGLSPWPGAFSFLDGAMVKVLETEVVPGVVDPGALSSRGKDSLAVGTGKDLLRIVSLQPEGKRPMTAAEFLRGHRGAVGKKFLNKQGTHSAEG